MGSVYLRIVKQNGSEMGIESLSQIVGDLLAANKNTY